MIADYISNLGGVLLLGLGLVIYFIPAIFALKRRHPNRFPVLFANLVVGWTVLGWVVALIWATVPSQPMIITVIKGSELDLEPGDEEDRD